ncbi:prenyltransferase/squalene oxidase repeat-containing protein [Saccharothrix isguenensis]
MSLRRTSAVIATAAVAALALVPPAQGLPDTPVTTDASEAAAGWLARQLIDGDHFAFPGTTIGDQGATLDGVFALAAAGVASDSADKAMAWLAKPEVVLDYLHLGDPAESIAGSHAKLALAVQVRGEDPTKFAGVDLIAGLTALQAPSGRFVNKSKYPDFSNGFSQAFAVLALERWEGAPEAAVGYLVGQQCEEGGFPLLLEEARCAPHADATAMAVQALLALDRTDVAEGRVDVAGSVAEALQWLTANQQPGGGFLDDKATGEGNANSTGLAAQALRAAGRTAEADKATAFLTSLQVGCTAADAERGAIALDKSGFARDTAQRASAQGILGLVGVSFADLTAEGGTAGAPVLDCPATTTTPTSSTTDTTTTTTSATAVEPTTTATEVTATSTTTVAAVADRPGDLARTGAVVGPMLWIGVLMLVGGVLAVVLARKRYAGERQ